MDDRKRPPDDEHLSSEVGKRTRTRDTAEQPDDDAGSLEGETTDGWTDDIHRAFVEAIYEIGMQHASPSIIKDNMFDQDESLTSERIKSHLQKYRKSKDKSKDEFMTEYDKWIEKAITVGAAGGTSSSLVPPENIVQMMGNERLLGGDSAAFLTYATLADGRCGLQENIHNLTPTVLRDGSREYMKHFTGCQIPLPTLTDEERHSPLGVSMSYVLGLFYSMNQVLLRERQVKGIINQEFDTGSTDEDKDAHT